MIIHKPRLTEEGDEIGVSTKIEIENPKIIVPDTLWFKLPQSYREYVTDRTDAFVVAMLPIAMTLGEDIEVKGVVSPRLAYGIQEYQHVQNAWRPKQFKIIDIRYSELKSTSEMETKGAVGCSFSGGVDSFYSLWRHLPKNEKIPEYRITHCIIINGFDNDVDLDNTGFFQKILLTYEPMIQNLGLKLVVIRTNQQQFRLAAIGPRNLHHSYGAVLTSSALVLGRLFSRFYIPGTHKYGKLIPVGSHIIFDHLLSTESMETINDGANASRVEKTAVIAQWPETYSRLRACFYKTKINEKTGTIENCCRCEKCIRTMIPLDLLGVLPEYTTYPLPLKRKYIRKTKYLSESSHIFAKGNLDFAVKIGRKDMAFDIRYAMLRSQVIKKIGLPVYVRLTNIRKFGK